MYYYFSPNLKKNIIIIIIIIVERIVDTRLSTAGIRDNTNIKIYERIIYVSVERFENGTV